LAKRPIHIVVVDAGTVLRAWTHFECKKGYLKSLLKTESELIKSNILINTEGKEVKVQDYNEYSLLKRKTLLYLSSNALSEA
jgi:hypothetical protein